MFYVLTKERKQGSFARTLVILSTLLIKLPDRQSIRMDGEFCRVCLIGWL
jgi:hypothetical protein